MIEICTVGGFDEVGRNMTAIKVDDEVVILDMGVFLDNYIPFNNKVEEGLSLDPNALIKADAVPNINFIEDWRKKVIAIIPSHAHLDHVGAIPYLAGGTALTMLDLKKETKDFDFFVNGIDY